MIFTSHRILMPMPDYTKELCKLLSQASSIARMARSRTKATVKTESSAAVMEIFNLTDAAQRLREIPAAISNGPEATEKLCSRWLDTFDREFSAVLPDSMLGSIVKAVASIREKARLELGGTPL